jgi:predicted ATPase
LEEERGIRGFSVGVGIHTGLVVVGEVGTDLRVEYTAMGEAPNLAARLESAAEPGTVLISEEAHQLIAPLFETEALEPIEVRGWEQPVPVFRVLAAKEVPGKVRGVTGLESPLVGREVEFAALREAVERLRVGVGGIVTIVGDAGIGKSRLVAELRKEILAKASQPAQGLRHVQWLEGRCLSYGTSIAYLLWLDVLRGLLGVTPEATPAQVLDALQARAMALCPESFDAAYPYLARLMSLPLEDGLAARLDDSHSQDLKTSTFRAIETLVVGVASECPLVLVCEDLHWADPSSIELLERLLSLTDRTGLLLICAFRPRRESRCWRVREVAARDYPHRHTDVLLGPLSSDQSLALVCNLLRIRSMPAQFRHRILSVAEGNPTWKRSYVGWLIEVP